MDNFNIIRWILVLLTSGLFTSFQVQAQSKKMNVLFIIADDLNCNLGTYDHYLVKTPNIDQLAKDGMQFNNAFCNFPVCGPSRASMMTGLYPDQTGHYKLRDHIRQHVPDVVTMSQNFMNTGYTAARVGKIYHYDNPSGIGTPGHDDSVSWNERYYPRGIDKDIEKKIFSLRPGKFGATLSWLAAEGSDEEHTDGKVATKAIELLGKYKSEDKPFFLGIGFYKPHTPFVAPAKYFDLYKTNDIKVPQVPKNYLATLPEPATAILQAHKEQVNLPDSLARSAAQAYYATISFLDAQVGRVLAALDSLGLRDNTIIVFTSDNGYHMGEHGHYQKSTLFEDSDRIPLIISYPGMKSRGKTSNSIVEMIDLYPTLSQLAGIKTPGYISGRSFKKVLDDPNYKTRESALSQVRGGYTLRTEKYRYTRWRKDGPNMTELYDRLSDPQEMNNLSGAQQYGDLIKKLDKQLTDRIEESAVAPKGLTVIK
ncbi:sulfatase [Parapedobacter sp. SGR-10]|uniref:sulfatase n=1 Tax=Parapedobacter sp. SGR-10 TaxID=2710879 RepID=UPI0013D3C2DA|nr:sulfatase [Parapedobacter sp. SGR-10]NGF56727.1 sulfatase [Parapedobacter sp. SGR-10]